MKKSKTTKEKAKPNSKIATAQLIKEITKAEGIISALGDGLSIMDRTFKILYENKVHKELIGDHVGEKCYKAYQKRKGVCVECPVALAFQDGKVHTVQKDKNTRFVEITASPLKDSEGNIIAGIELVRDVTERNRAEKMIKDSEKRYRLLFNNGSDAVIVHEIFPNVTEANKFRIVEANDIACQYLGYSREELLQMNVAQLDASGRRKDMQGILQRIFTEGRARWEGVHVHKDGHTIPVEITNQLFYVHDKPMVLASARDITERKQAETAAQESEQRLKNIIEHSNELHYVHDTSHVLSYASPQSLQVLGYTPEEMIIEWTRLATDNPINKTGIEITEKAIKTGKKQEKYLLELYRKDGSKVLLEIDESPLKNKVGNVIGIVGAARDVTEKERIATIEEKQKQRKERVLLNQAALLELTTTKINDIERFWEKVAVINAQTLGIERVGIWFFNWSRTEIICEVLYLLSRHTYEKGLKLQKTRHPEYFKTLKETHMLVADDVLSDSRMDEIAGDYLKPFGIVSKMDVPIRYYGEIIGVMSHEHTEPRQWTDEDKEFASSLASIVSFSIETKERRKAEKGLKKREEELEKRVQELEDFYDMAVGRELRMIELKDEIKELKEELEKLKKP